MNAELQRAQDMLTAMQAQRDQALNALVMVQAELVATRREMASEPKSDTDAHSND